MARKVRHLKGAADQVGEAGITSTLTREDGTHEFVDVDGQPAMATAGLCHTHRVVMKKPASRQIDPSV
jgi:hypothetical protein